MAYKWDGRKFTDAKTKKEAKASETKVDAKTTPKDSVKTTSNGNGKAPKGNTDANTSKK